MTIQVTKQYGYKAISSIPGWSDDIATSDKVNSPAQAYALVPLIYRAIRLRCDSLAKVPLVLEKGETALDWPFLQTDAYDLIWRTEAALLLSGAAYWLKIGKGRRVTNLQWLNPFTMGVSYANGVVKFSQDIGSDHREYTADQIVYFHEFNPIDDIGPGVGAAAVALNDAGLMRYMSRFAAKFFEGGVMPVVLLGIDGNPQDAEIKKAETFFKRAASGISNLGRVLGIRAGMIHPTILTPPIKDLAMPELNDQARRAIAGAFGIPQTMLEDAANFATAEAHEQQFWRSTIEPRGSMLASAANRQLFKDAGIEMSFAFESLDIFQTEEVERAASLSTFIDYLTKCPTYEIAQAAAVNFGYELTDDLLLAMQAWFAGKEKKAAEIQDNIDNAQNQPDAQEPPANEPADEKQTVGELRAWRKKAIRRMKAGKACGSFESEYIPAGIAGAIEGQLEAAKTADDVDHIFADAIEGYGHS